jgi:hypothetical protein
MAKQQEIKKLNPGDCLRSLQAFHEQVTMLTILVKNFSDEIPNEHIRKQFIASAKAVTAFYEQ